VVKEKTAPDIPVKKPVGRPRRNTLSPE